MTCQILHVETRPSGALVDLVALDPLDIAGWGPQRGVPFTLHVGRSEGVAWSTCLSQLIDWASGDCVVAVSVGGQGAAWVELAAGDVRMLFDTRAP